MGANSLPRRALKRVLAPLMSERNYQLIQSVAMAWDIRRGNTREPELDLIDAVVRPGDQVIDIGANYGFWAHPMSRAVGDSGRVYAFEPVPFTFGALKNIASIFRMKNVELINKGCGETNGRVKFTVPVQDSGAVIAGLVHMGQRDDAREGKDTHARFSKTKEIDCEVVMIDSYLPGLERVSMIKCDIEGADLFALRGAKDTIARNRPLVVCEINPWFVQGFGLKVEDIVSFFRGLGYGCYRYEHQRLVATKTEDIVEDNWVFVHDDNRAKVAHLI